MAASPTAGESERLESQRMISQLKQQVTELQQQLAQQQDESRGLSKESTLKEAYNRGYKEVCSLEMGHNVDNVRGTELRSSS